MVMSFPGHRASLVEGKKAEHGAIFPGGVVGSDGYCRMRAHKHLVIVAAGSARGIDPETNSPAGFSASARGGIGIQIGVLPGSFGSTRGRLRLLLWLFGG